MADDQQPTEVDDGVEATAWRFLRDLYSRLLCGKAGVHPGGMTEPERALLLEPHHRDMEADLSVVMSLVGKAQSDVASRWREQIHRAEGIDHEMIDEAIDYALAPPSATD